MAFNFSAASQTVSLSPQLIYVPGDIRSCYHATTKRPMALNDIRSQMHADEG